MAISSAADVGRAARGALRVPKRKKLSFRAERDAGARSRGILRPRVSGSQTGLQRALPRGRQMPRLRAPASRSARNDNFFLLGTLRAPQAARPTSAADKIAKYVPLRKAAISSCAQRDSNPQPRHYECLALTIELWARLAPFYFIKSGEIKPGQSAALRRARLLFGREYNRRRRQLIARRSACFARHSRY